MTAIDRITDLLNEISAIRGRWDSGVIACTSDLSGTPSIHMTEGAFRRLRLSYKTTRHSKEYDRIEFVHRGVRVFALVEVGE